MVTEGAVTEPEYLKAFNRVFGQRALRLSIISGVGEPHAVVERAIAELDAQSRETLGTGDTVWAMFDRDAHARFTDAVNAADRSGIGVATSNPCFELWGIYHFQDFHAPINRHDCQRILEGLCESYSRRGSKNFANEELIREKYCAAINRAENSLVRRAEEGTPDACPSTTVHRLTEHFRGMVASAD